MATDRGFAKAKVRRRLSGRGAFRGEIRIALAQHREKRGERRIGVCFPPIGHEVEASWSVAVMELTIGDTVEMHAGPPSSIKSTPRPAPTRLSNRSRPTS